MKHLINLIMIPVTILYLLGVFVIMLAAIVPLVPFVILAAPAAIINDCSPTREPWNKMTGWKRMLMAPYLFFHKILFEKILGMKQVCI